MTFCVRCGMACGCRADEACVCGPECPGCRPRVVWTAALERAYRAHVDATCPGCELCEGEP